VDARTQFREADRLYREGKYMRAMALLEDLRESFPDEHRILFPLARCLAKLGRHDEARDVAKYVADEFDYRPARRFLKALDEHTGIAPEQVSSHGFSTPPPLQEPEEVMADYASRIEAALERSASNRDEAPKVNSAWKGRAFAILLVFLVALVLGVGIVVLR
jgi:thioredoxin-like negative regulator of GroEL